MIKSIIVWTLVIFALINLCSLILFIVKALESNDVVITENIEIQGADCCVWHSV